MTSNHPRRGPQLIALTIALIATALASAAPIDLATLAASDGHADSFFGFGVAMFEETAVIGAHGDNANGVQSGAAYVFVLSEGCWHQHTKLMASDAQPGDQFGGNVAVSEDTILVGARGVNDRGDASGAVYVFVRTPSGWTQQAKLTASDGSAGSAFGQSVALVGNTAIIGAPRDDSKGEDSGSAYVFTRSGTQWRQQAKLIASDGAAGDVFGISVAIDGKTALVGADLDDDGGDNTGSVYVYVNSDDVWHEQAKLTAADASDVDIFGVRVAISGETALIAARRDDDEVKGPDTGSAYVFVRTGTTWAQQAKLTAADAESGDLFGFAVALEGDIGIITAAMEDDGARNAGAAYVFTRSGSTWTQQRKVTIEGAADNDALGSSVALSNGVALVGAPTSIVDPPGRAGSAAIFELDRITKKHTVQADHPNGR